MISADTSVFVDFFRGAATESVDILQKALSGKQLVMNPFVLTELLSSPKLPQKAEKYLLVLPRIELFHNFFESAGLLRRKIYEHGKGISMSDIYIAQACIDAELSLLTLDEDFLVISAHSRLALVQI